VFDLFYKIKTLHKLGIKIHLHCFEYGRGEQDELKNIAKRFSIIKETHSLMGLDGKYRTS